MIPLRDNIRIRSFFPFITLILIAINCYAFYLELSAANKQFNMIIADYALIPAYFIRAILQQPANIANYLPLITNLFLHGGWFHIIGNMWFLWLFGRTSEACLGHVKYLLFYIVCGITANLVQVAFDYTSSVPLIGASGAVSGILGSYVFCFPNARISTLVPIFFFFTIIEIPAILYIGFWFLLQLYEGAMAEFIAGSNVAWWAHVGGFMAGIVLNNLFNRNLSLR